MSRKKAQSSGGIATGIILRKRAIEGYYKNPKICKQCKNIIHIAETDRVAEVKRKTFCNYGCSKEYYTSQKKNKIIELFYQGKKFSDIAFELNCAKSTVSYYCSELIPEDKRYAKGNIKKYQRYYDTYGWNLGKTARFFGLNKWKLKRILDFKPKKKVTRKQRIENQKQLVCDYRRKNKIKAVEYKGGKCQNCSYKKSVCCLDFHHVNPDDKEFSISSVTRKWETLKIELNKCVLVCRNCHGEIHEEIQLKGFSKILDKILNECANG